MVVTTFHPLEWNSLAVARPIDVDIPVIRTVLKSFIIRDEERVNCDAHETRKG
jgi:hypothetical protein